MRYLASRQVIFFLIGAMTVVETVDAHQGFKIVTDAIATRDKRKLLWLARPRSPVPVSRLAAPVNR